MRTLSRQATILHSTLALSSVFLPPLPSSAQEPTAEQVAVAKRAFQAFDAKQLPLADALFTQTIDAWRELDRGVEEMTALLVARAGVRTDLTAFVDAKRDLDEAILLMSRSGEAFNGMARYREYPDAFVQRGLAREGLRDWAGAVADYDKAVQLWGGTGDGVNPFALSYRGRARAETGDYEGALEDFSTAANVFARVDKNDNQAAAARANMAVTLYGLGRKDEAVKIAKQVITRTPGFTDLHVMLAADSWDRGDRTYALQRWEFACSNISSGCKAYRDVAPGGWLEEVRRWPPNLVQLQRNFLAKTPAAPVG
jgi:tetratricopeptide (TPR) repeat protein